MGAAKCKTKHIPYTINNITNGNTMFCCEHISTWVHDPIFPSLVPEMLVRSQLVWYMTDFIKTVLKETIISIIQGAYDHRSMFVAQRMNVDGI